LPDESQTPVNIAPQDGHPQQTLNFLEGMRARQACEMASWHVKSLQNCDPAASLPGWHARFARKVQLFLMFRAG
jgi:hypothetical protein